ncbi:hypothetical protein [uncultured Cohaesibacter sp.]|uniref:hypothetical protein n=1 Tax=uncultured Cohaesibacter sp. TaxID=1002546 RepID=UPI002AAB6472|nr:hypothetical protein [uncultured Cohaesibacter sp.]
MIRFFIAASLFLAGPAFAETCENGAIFEAQDNDGNQHVLKTNGLVDPFIFEMHTAGHLVWTLEAEQGCSNGISVCWMSVQTTEEEPIDIPVETVQEGDGIKYYVFAHLRQTLASLKMDDEQFDTMAQWNIERPDDLFESLAMPVNVYAFKGCR